VRRLDETNVENACRFPDEFRRERDRHVKTSNGSIEIELLPYAVARIDWEDL
jgi:hypothetical protein